jgi:hypothetical protein
MASHGYFSWGKGGERTSRGIHFLGLTVQCQERQVVDIERSIPQVTAKRNLVPRDYLPNQEGVYAVRKLLPRAT